MATPSLYPLFLKAQSGGGSGTQGGFISATVGGSDLIATVSPDVIAGIQNNSIQANIASGPVAVVSSTGIVAVVDGDISAEVG